MAVTAVERWPLPTWAVSVRAVVPRVQEVAVATPLPFVVTGVAGSTVPFAPVALNVTATPATGLPFASFTITDGGELTAAPAVPGWLVGLFAAIVAAVDPKSVAEGKSGDLGGRRIIKK